MDRTPVPLYHRLYVALSGRIEAGKYPPGSQLPPDRVLMEEFRVSRQTVLAAMQRLTVAGMIARFPGRGTFVVETHEQRTHWRLDSIEDLIEAGHASRYDIIGVQLVPAESEARLCGTFGLSPGDMLLFVRALRSSEEGPYAYSRIHMPRTIGERLPRELLPTRPLLLLLESHAGIAVAEARQATSAVPADREMAAVLEVPEGAPLLLMRRTYFAEDGRAIVHSSIAAPSDRYEQVVQFRRRDVAVKAESPRKQQAIAPENRARLA